MKRTVREASLARMALDIAFEGVSYDPYDGGENLEGGGFLMNLRGWCA